MTDIKKTQIYSQLESGVEGGYVTDYSQICGTPGEKVQVLTQKIHLVKGIATMVSFYVDVTLDDLGKALGDKEIYITTRLGYGEFINGEWWGSLMSLPMNESYRLNIHPSSPYDEMDIYISGRPVNPKDIVITTSPNIGGWVWLAYPLTQAMPIKDAIIIAEEGDVIKTTVNGVDLNSTYTGGEWVGDFTDLEPGIGYRYQNNVTTSVSFQYPSDSYNVIDLSPYATRDEVSGALTEAKEYTDAKIQYIPNESSMPATPKEGVLYLIGEEE